MVWKLELRAVPESLLWRKLPTDCRFRALINAWFGWIWEILIQNNEKFAFEKVKETSLVIGSSYYLDGLFWASFELPILINWICSDLCFKKQSEWFRPGPKGTFGNHENPIQFNKNSSLFVQFRLPFKSWIKKSNDLPINYCWDTYIFCNIIYFSLCFLSLVLLKEFIGNSKWA